MSKCYKVDEYLLSMPWEPKERQCTSQMIELLVKHSFQRGKPAGPGQAFPQQLARREHVYISDPSLSKLDHTSPLCANSLVSWLSPCFKTTARSPCGLLYLRLRLLSIFHKCLNSQFHNQVCCFPSNHLPAVLYSPGPGLKHLFMPDIGILV